MSRGVSTPTQPAIHAFPRRASNSMTTPKISIARPHHRFTLGDDSGGPVVIVKNAIRSITPGDHEERADRYAGNVNGKGQSRMVFPDILASCYAI